MNDTFDDADAPERRDTQYFEILGNRAIYHDGWIASCFHGRLPWIRLQGFEFDGEQERWELYRVSDDFSQSVDLAGEFPDKLAELRGCSTTRRAQRRVSLARRGLQRGGDRACRTRSEAPQDDVHPAHVRMPESSVVNLKNASSRSRPTSPCPTAARAA